MRMSDSSHLIVTLICDDQPGIVHAISGAVVSAEGNITESQQFSSHDTGRFFMRLQVETARGARALEDALQPVVDKYDMEHSVTEVGKPLKTLILGSTAKHCVVDLLSRGRDGHLNIDVPLVLANHPNLEDTTKLFDVPFEWMPITSAEEKASFEARVLEVVEQHDVDLVVLARYMQVLSPRLCETLAGRAINIHHSFLPGFKGANPYRQAHERGVKLIGATAHFVTEDLDEGPIIEQNVVRVEHSQSVSELVRVGQDEESRTLAQAVSWFAEHRILLDGIRTIIFR
jgi:formyltetrahydrofolate deformylase